MTEFRLHSFILGLLELIVILTSVSAAVLWGRRRRTFLHAAWLIPVVLYALFMAVSGHELSLHSLGLACLSLVWLRLLLLTDGLDCRYNTVLVWLKRYLRRRGRHLGEFWDEVADTYRPLRPKARGQGMAATELVAAEAPAGRGTEPEASSAPAGRGNELEGAAEAAGSNTADAETDADGSRVRGANAGSPSAPTRSRG